MLTIWKYQLEVVGTNTVQIPRGGRVLAVQTQRDIPCIWVLVDPDNSLEAWRFYVYGTGHEVLSDPDDYLGTVQVLNGRLVFHVFGRRE